MIFGLKTTRSECMRNFHLVVGVLVIGCFHQAYTATANAASSVDISEAYFNGTAYLRLLTPMPIWGHSAISFRSCKGGEILSQQYNRHTLSLFVLNDYVQVSLAGGAVRVDARLDYKLLDNKWHTIQFLYEFGKLNLIVDKSHNVIANSTYNTAFLTNQEVKNEAAVLILGSGYNGCLQHGPGLIFNASSMNAESVVFGTCPISLGPCSDQEALIKMQPDHCLHEPCMRQGICTSNSEGYECHCTLRYTGKNCEVDLGSLCKSTPCENGATCKEDDKGNYECICPPTHSGLKCENEISSHPLCADQPCRNNGSCRVSNGNTIECDCLRGFSGQFCEVNNDDCASQPCYNNGKCVDMVNGFACDCSGTGYSGTFCQIDIKECSANPCQNGGKCFDTYGSYICECLSGFGGDNCEKQTNECQYQPCQNGASCIDKRGTIQCVCPPGFSGMFCEVGQSPPCPQCPIDSECVNGKCVCKPGTAGPIGHCEPTSQTKPTPSSPQSRSAQLNACSHSICLNGGTCKGNASNYTCICASGFTGVHCENAINDCKCLNGGVCSSNTTMCTCPHGYEGSKCEKHEQCSRTNCPSPMVCLNNKCLCPEGINCEACNSNPCRNGATCRAKGSSYECICPEGWNGTDCEIDIDECKIPNSKPCSKGICINEQGGFKCYCEPGFTGIRCDVDVDECLSKPCQNGATCVNQINDFKCLCQPGYSGKDCSIDIDECASNPCSEGSTCKDLVNNFSCICIPGLTGRLCDIDINDCESAPCQHNGQCIDELNGFHCNCSSTGYTGDFCQINIDECASNPCTNGAECIDKVNDYVCQCYPGYEGKNCEIDKNECEPNPCQYNGTCLERSNTTLYAISDRYNLPKIFSQNFSYEIASGYECICVNGIVGKNCETNINECESNPCIPKHGMCIDGVGSYICECDPGFEGTHCEININECDKYTPCKHGTCIDQTNDYICDCDMNYGGKNCSVELIGCLNSPCKNNGTCKPFLINETDHHFNCTCQHGYQGETCEKLTTISMVLSSLITAKTTREEGYDISFQFRTTLPNGVLAFGTSGSQNEPVSYILELINGRLNLHSSLLNKWEGVFIGSNLNDSNWHKFFVAINTSHLVLSANDEQAIYPIGSYESANGSQTYFPTTFLGGNVPNLKYYLRHLTHQPTSFVGCMRDIVINGKWIFPDETSDENTTELKNIASGCPRTEQCKPNPCHSNGQCQDLWHTFSCSCQRPHLGQTCKYNITAATFGHENTTHSAVIVDTDEKARRAVRSVLDISMFIRTRQPTGQVFYLGSDPRKNITPGKPMNDDSYVVTKLQGGELLVKMQFNGTPELYTVGGNKLDNGYNHLIQVIRNQTLVQVKLNGTEYFRKTLSSNGQLDAQVLYLGGPPPAADRSDLNLTDEEKDRLYFKGIIQDVQVSNGLQSMSVELYPLNKTEGLVLPKPFGKVSIDQESVLRGEVSDDLCRKKPCQHNAECKNTWNDFECTCPKGYKGKYCQDIEFCQLNKCPGNGICQNLDDGFECITNVTFKGNEKTPLSFAYFNKNQEEEVKLPAVIEISYRSKTGGTLFYVQDEDNYFEIAVFKDQVTVQWRLGGGIDYPTTRRFNKENTKFDWNTIHLRVHNGKLECGFKGWEDQPDIPSAFTEHIEEGVFQDLISGKHPIYLGGMPLGDNVLSKSQNSGAIFKGCLGEVRVGQKLLPFFLYNEMYSDSVQLRSQFKLNGPKVDEGCVLCFQEDCQNGGVCTNSSEQYACTCKPGFEGDDCSVDIDECLTAECTNNSTCIDEIAGFTCNCLPGYDGTLCEHEIDECASNPCHNGGNCTDRIASFECECTEDYAGTQCDVLKLVTCDTVPNPCKKGSTCVDGFNATTGNNFTCNCMTGYQGPMCDVPFCLVKSCKNGGFCLNSEPLQPPICQCSIGYQGEYCENDINECESNPCQNGGQCIDEVGAYRCNCTGTGFEGPQCEIDIDECSVGRRKCGGKGVCINMLGSFRCECAIGLCGYDCNLQDPCSSKEIGVCDNGGVCVERCTDFSDYLCNCTTGFMGKTCSQLARETGGDSSSIDIALIVIPIVVILLLILGAALGTFLVIARNKRATRGTYSPSAQEYCNPRLEMDNVLKPPPEERLI